MEQWKRGETSEYEIGCNYVSACMQSTLSCGRTNWAEWLGRHGPRGMLTAQDILARVVATGCNPGVVAAAKSAWRGNLMFEPNRFPGTLGKYVDTLP